MPPASASRRAEFVTLGLVLVSLILIGLPDARQLALARSANQFLLLPLSRVEAIFGGYLGLRSENRQLRAELERARLELAAAETARLENLELHRLLGFREEQPVALLPTRVIDRDFRTLPTTFHIDVGSEDGVTPDLPVVTAGGMVGKTVVVGAGVTEVMLFTHVDFGASALLVGGDHLEYGSIRAGPNGVLQLFLPLRSRSERGDRIVTSGYGGAFPRGIPIGEVRSSREDRLGLEKIDLVAPAVDLGTVTSAFVLLRDVEAGQSSGDVVRLFWPGYAYPPMVGEPFDTTDDDGEPADDS